MKNWIQNKKENGFTIMETLVAIFIILLAITGPMVFTQNGLRTAFVARDQITAFYLAQDAIEFVKNKKDDNGVEYLNTGTYSPSWLVGLGYCMSPNWCTVDTFNSDIENCSDGTLEPGCFGQTPSQDVPLKILDEAIDYGDNGLMGHEGSQDSIFARQIQIEEIRPDAEAKVTVQIRWQTNEGLGYREITVQENVTNWLAALAGVI